MNDVLLNDIAGILVLTGAVPILGATLTFGLGSPWFRSWLGRVMFALFFALVVVFGIVIGRRAFGEYPGYGFVALIGYIYITVTLWAVWAIIIVERRKPEPFAFPPRKDALMGEHESETPDAPSFLAKSKKAIAGGIAAAVTAGSTAVVEAMAGGFDPNTELWPVIGAVVGGFVVGFAVVWAAPKNATS